MRFLTLALLLASVAACGKTASQVRSGEAWSDARPADYKASYQEVIAACEQFLDDREFRIEYNDDRSYLKCHRKGDSLGEQSIELHIKIEAAPAVGFTRVTAISGRSSGVVWKGRHMDERLHKHLAAAFRDR